MLGQHNCSCQEVLDSGLGDGPVLAVDLVQGAVQAPRHVLVAALICDSELDRCEEVAEDLPQ
jgi:hypothetical protein